MIYGQAGATSDFYQYRLEFGFGEDPVEWELLDKSKIPVNDPDLLHEWDVIGFPSGVVTLRLILISTRETTAELRMQVDLQVPTPTPTPTNTPTMTPTPTVTRRIWRTRTPRTTPTPTDSQSDSMTPTLTPTPSPTP
jgi:hypothetical protein